MTGRTIADATPEFAEVVRPPAGAPNVVMIVLDDVGFGQLGCFGSDVATPTIDQVAADGVRFNRFHVTSLCSPTRACLLTGRNHHAVGMGFLTEVPIGFPGYTGRIPPETRTLPALLRDAGYNTFAVGKWHLTPRWEQSPAGPFDRWPLGMGFERYYGFLGGDTNQWTPNLVRDNSRVDPPRRPEEGYHVSEDLIDEAIRLVLDQRHVAPDKPFFLYLATGAAHAPHHVPAEWIDRYRGQFDAGWEAWRDATFARQVERGVVPALTTLTERPPWVREWTSLSSGERRLFARMMEVYAGFLSHTDDQLGRLLRFLADVGALDDTLLLVLSDNGASGEGGPIGSFNEHRFTHDMLDDFDETLAQIDELGGYRAYNHYPWGWAWAGNSPFRLWKRYSWLGGVRVPLVVRWPALGEEGGRVASQFCHAVDVMPAILEAAGLAVPDGLDGASFLSSDGRETQYFEMLGSRAIYHAGWKATTDHVGQQMSIERELLGGSHDFDADAWSLFDLNRDFAEADDVAGQHPERVRQLVDLWESEARRNQVFPMDDSFVLRAVALVPSPYPPRARTVYLPGGRPILEDFLPPLGAGFDLVADVEVPERPHGVICALGDWSNGWALYLLDGCPVVTFNLFGAVTRVASPVRVEAGARAVGVRYRRDGMLSLIVDGAVVAIGKLDSYLPLRWQVGVAGLELGRHSGFPVGDDYNSPFPFSGTLHAVVVEIPALRDS